MSGFFGGGGTTPVNMVGASTSTAGTAGYVPAPAAGKNTRYLSSDASFGEVPILPKYKNAQAGHYLGHFGNSDITNASFTAPIKVRYFLLSYAPADGSIDTLSFRIGGTAPTSSVNINLAAWQCGEDGLPSTYIIGGNGASGTISSTTIDISIAATAIVRGFFYLSFTSDATSSGNNFLTFTAANHSWMGSVFGFNAFGTSSPNCNFPYYTATTYDQITHETFTIGQRSSATIIPDIRFQYV